MFRTHTCGELNKKNVGQEIILSGWIHGRRDHGGLIFIDLRDRYGITQVVFQPENSAVFKIAETLRSEWVIKITGNARLRPKEMINSKLSTGEIEVEAKNIEILSESKTLPFELNEEKSLEANEALRLKYRFIDLRRSKLQEMLKIKDDFFQYIRKYFHECDFIEVQTPILANSSPEGARDFLVPSRIYPGKFYALPQAPQQFKQLLMVGGLDKYFQIAPCFRDEDPRMDRHYGEFYQLDMEMSFVQQEDIWAIMEPLWIKATQKFSNKKLVGLEKDGSFKKIPWKEAMEKYGTDKPDLRFDMEIKPITDIVKDCGFSVFTEVIKNNGVVHTLKIDGGAKFSRKEIDEITEIAKTKGAKGLAYIKIEQKLNNYQLQTTNYKLNSPIVKFLGDELAQKIVKNLNGKTGDIIFFGADVWKIVCLSLGAVRNECALRLGLKDNTKAAWCWVIDFPMYDYSEIEEGKIDFSHNPFSMPQGGLDALNKKDPLEILAYQYDLILNGLEVSSGAIRNHNPEIMYKAFAIAGYTREQVDNKFGAMIRAFEYGAPPHGGNAPGIDRILMALLDLDSIRDIYAFPKDGNGKDLMMDSPSKVDEKQLEELYIKIIRDENEKILEKKVQKNIFSIVKKFLDDNQIKYESLRHKPVYTSKEAAEARGTELKQGARALIFKIDNKFIQIVCSAIKQVDTYNFKKIFNIKKMELASPKEVLEITGCEIGAVPPFGNLFDLPIYVDISLSLNEIIAFNAGSNVDSIKIKYSDYIKLVKPKQISNFSK